LNYGARCWLLRLMYRHMWCKHLECTYSVCFRLVGTDIRKQTHKKAKSVVRRNLGGRSPPITVQICVALHAAISAIPHVLFRLHYKFPNSHQSCGVRGEISSPMKSKGRRLRATHWVFPPAFFAGKLKIK